MNIGFVIGESKPDFITIQSSKPLAIGEYVIVNSNEGEILCLIGKSVIVSDAFSVVKNYQEAEESKELANDNPRDKSFISNLDVLGFLSDLKKGKMILPSIPPFPGTEVKYAQEKEIQTIFAQEGKKWVRVGNLLRNKDIEARINLSKLIPRHLAVLAMTGMGKSNLITLIIKKIAEVHGTVIIFDYHDEYSGIKLKNINSLEAKINPRHLEFEEFAEVLEIPDSWAVQRTVLKKAFTNKVKQSKEFWLALKNKIDEILESPEEKDNRHAAQRVLEKIDLAQIRFGDILDPDTENPISLIKEGFVNIINTGEFSEKQANISLAFYLREILDDRKKATISKRNNQRISKGFHFNSPVFIIVEEAHVFIPKEGKADAKYWMSKIAREGRKFSIGLGIVSQRPRNIDPNVLSQMGSFAIMRLIQPDDQNQIMNSVESVSRDLIRQITSLNVGNAILTGQWVNLPSVVEIDEQKDKIMGADADPIQEWEMAHKMKNIAIENTQKIIRHDLVDE